MKRVLFLDRDGVILKEPPEDMQVDSLEKMEFVPGVITGLRRILDKCEFDRIALVSNQDGMGTSDFPEIDFRRVQDKMENILEGEGIIFDEVLIDRTFPEENAETRKPGTGMLKSYLNGKFDLPNSFVIGDRVSDMQLAENLGCRGIWFTGKEGESAAEDMSDVTVVLISEDWGEISDFLISLHGSITLKRKTTETDIEITLNPDGRGKGKIRSGLRFFDHMLEQFAFHSGCDLFLSVSGDLEVDEHHTIEDTALVMGEAFRTILGTQKGCRRYGFILPMDDSIAQVALDTGGRAWLKWECEFTREKVGDVPTEMFSHFFRSLSVAAGWTIHISVRGENDHHKIESVFKSFARALKNALKKGDTRSGVPSTKGSI